MSHFFEIAHTYLIDIVAGIEVNKSRISQQSMQFLDKNVTNINICYRLSIFLSINIEYYIQLYKLI